MIDRNKSLRNTLETVTEKEFDDLIKSKTPTVYCGFEVSGPVHLGTLIAAHKLLDFQVAGAKVKVLLADIHTRLNRKGDQSFIDQQIKYWETVFKSIGLTEADYVLGSSFQFEKEYVCDVLELAVNSTLNRALRSMQEVARDIENARVSQAIYPLMQIADIKALKADIAYGGMEQRKIHMLARELLPGVGGGKPVCIHTPLLVSLKGPGMKMSSSQPETLIKAQEKPDTLRQRINSAYCPKEKEGNPILQVCEHLLLPQMNVLEVERPEKYGGNLNYTDYISLESDYLSGKLHPQDLKSAVAEGLVDLLEPVRRNLV
ncbi:MAG: tyrosine--tRNA ligase [Candidatus Altiarchaeales archaeon]|nr:tyrosine--tRNA ligase [Candidatus Altiarchaeales archaeon]